MATTLVGIAEAARALGVSADTVRRLIGRRQIKAVRIARRVLVPQSAIDAACEHGVATDHRSTSRN